MKIRLFTIPNLLTLSNLFCGAIATTHALLLNDLTGAFCWIAIGAVFDFFDGFAARLLGHPTGIGIELDSLADDITFGLAPGAMLFALYRQMPGLWLGDHSGWFVFIFSMFAALRLAKFNVDGSQHVEFAGLPTPAATLFCASLCMLSERFGILLQREWILALAIVMALLMISPVRMFSLKFHGFGWRGNGIRYIFLLGCAALLFWLREFAIPVIVALYVVISTVRWLFVRTREE